MPALLQRTCTAPKVRSASSAARAKASRSVTSSSSACTLADRPLSANPFEGALDVVPSYVCDDDVHSGR